MTRSALVALLAIATPVSPATAQQWEITTIEDKFAGGVRAYTADSPANPHGGSLALACRPGQQVAINLSFGSVKTLVSETGPLDGGTVAVRIKLDGVLAKRGIVGSGVFLQPVSDGVYQFLRSDMGQELRRSETLEVETNWDTNAGETFSLRGFAETYDALSAMCGSRGSTPPTH